ncbi:MAG: pantetheine-phosphate adenylyltransferase [Alistipes sp.]|mgnify:CR=1 FL=1|nr:pantetheine-phosphate adenylyltransferase [Alistipes sp.]
MPRVAIFPGSFDPFTRGHEAIVDEALRIFDRVIIAIGHNPAKRGLLTVESRKALIERVYATEPRVEVSIYSTLTGIEAERLGASTIIRSVRNTLDFEYERTMDRANREVFPNLRTIMLFAPKEVEHISSSLVRELNAFGHPTESLLPEGIKLEEYI